MERKYLKVELNANKIEERKISEEVSREWVGGRGFGIKYLYEGMAPEVDPLSPENKLIILTGPLAGTGALGASRWMVITKSPLTQTYMRSVGGADFGAWLAFAGFDFIQIEGKSKKPSYLYIEKDKWEIMDADFLWGKLTSEVESLLKEKHGKDVRVACIGPSAEKLVKFGIIISGGRSASRGGVGTVMGSKNLKAIVVKGKGPREVYDREMMKDLIQEEIFSTRSAITFEGFSEEGTASMAAPLNMMGVYPTKNFQWGILEGWEKIGVEELFKYKIRNGGCYHCMVRCGNFLKIPRKGPYEGKEIEGPEYETIWAFSAPTGCADVGAILEANAICDEFGLDTISAGNAIGFAYELFEKGVIPREDTGGIELKYGDVEPMLELLQNIAERENIGDILAEGVKAAAKNIGKGADNYALEMKGLEIPAYEPRGLKTHGLSMITSNIGASHCIGYCVQELFGAPFPRPIVDRFSEDNIDVAIANQDLTCFLETGILCVFIGGMGMLPPLLMAKMLAAVTGFQEFSAPGCLFRIAEKIYNLERVFNLREGLGRGSDTVPRRLIEEPITNAGITTGQTIKNLGGMLDKYYRMRGWTEKGVPTEAKLKELGLEEVIRDIRKWGI